MDIGRSDFMAERRLRLANSSPDVKALFNAPAYIYNIETQEAPVETGYMAGNMLDQDLDYWTPTTLVPIVRHFFSLLSTKQAHSSHS